MRGPIPRAVALLAALTASVALIGPGCGESPQHANPPLPSALYATFSGDSTGDAYAAAGVVEFPERLAGTFRRPAGGTRADPYCEITLGWTECEQSMFASYSLYRDSLPGIEEDPLEADLICQLYRPASTFYVDEDVTWEEDYYYALRTSNTADLHSWSNEVHLLTPTPGAEGVPEPSVLSGYVIEVDSLVGLNWTVCPDFDFLSYELFRSSTPGIHLNPSIADLIRTTTDIADTSWTDAPSNPDQINYYALRTTDTDSLTSWSNELGFDLHPPDPSILAVDGVGVVSVALSWSECPDTDFESYGLYRSTQPGIPDDPDQADLVFEAYSQYETSWLDYPPATPGVYYYALVTEDESEWQAWSNEVQAVLLEIPLNEVTTLPVGPNVEDLVQLSSLSSCYLTNSISGGYVKCVSTSGYFVEDSISVGGTPFGICALPDQTHVYVSSTGTSQVSAIRTSDNTVEAVVDVGTSPHGLCSSPDGEYVYVCDSADGTVSAIRTSDNTVVGQADVGSFPWGSGCQPDGTHLFVANASSDDISVVRTSDLAVVATVGVGALPVDVCFTNTGAKAYVTCWSSGEVYVIDTAGHSVLDVIDVGPNPGGMVLHESGMLYVACEGGGSIHVINTFLDEVELTLSMSADPWCLDCSDDGQYVFVGNYSDGSLTVLGIEGTALPRVRPGEGTTGYAPHSEIFGRLD